MNIRVVVIGNLYTMSDGSDDWLDVVMDDGSSLAAMFNETFEIRPEKPTPRVRIVAQLVPNLGEEDE